MGDKLSGTVRNVVNFGAFVDIGLHDDGLVHVSRMSERRNVNPLDIVSVGDIVDVWVHEIDKERGRVGLSLLPPEKLKERDSKPRRGERKNDRRPQTPGRAPAKPKKPDDGMEKAMEALMSKFGR